MVNEIVNYVQINQGSDVIGRICVKPYKAEEQEQVVVIVNV